MPMNQVLLGLVDRPESFSCFDYYEPQVQEFAIRCIAGRGIMLDVQMRKCESPIERIMFGALYWHLICAQLERNPDSHFAIEPQYVVKSKTKLYRLDFLVRVSLNGKDYRVAVECDGHDYHERTREQARADKSRDRVLQARGYRVFRFTGSEIVKDADTCASEVVKAIFVMAGNQETV